MYFISNIYLCIAFALGFIYVHSILLQCHFLMSTVALKTCSCLFCKQQISNSTQCVPLLSSALCVGALLPSQTNTDPLLRYGLIQKCI